MTAALSPTPIPAADQTWLHMDRPNNLMHVHSLMWLDHEPELDDLLAVLQERVVDRFPVFSRRASELDGHWVWEDYEGFDLARHLTRVELPGDGDVAELRAYMARRFSAPFADELAMWDMTLIPNVTGLDDQPRAVIFSRFHHALADGIRLVQLALSLCDSIGGDPLPDHVGRGSGGGLLHSGVDVVRRSAGDALDMARGVGAGVRHLPGRVTHLGASAFEQGLDLLVHPGRLIDLVSGLASVHNQSVNTVAEVTRLLSAGKSVRTSWSGTPGVAKKVSWVNGLDLDAIKTTGRARGGTVNDIVLSIMSRALSRYLEAHDALVDEIHWLVPVSLVPMDKNLPAELGNHFSLVFLPMPLGIEDPDHLVDAVRARMTRLKESAEPVVSFGLQWMVAESPTAIAVRLTNLFANKAVGVLTNVPGPKSPMSLAGVPVAGMLGWAPTSGDQPMSLSIFSYNGKINIGIAADAHLIPDPDLIAQYIEEEYAALCG